MLIFNRRILLSLSLAATLPACDNTSTAQTTSPNHTAAVPAGSSAQSQASGLVLNLTSDVNLDPHSVLMGLHLAQKAIRNGMNNVVFLNVHGVKLFAPGAESLAFHNENFHQVLRSILDAGGQVFVCPHCAMVHNVKPENFLPGAKLSKEEVLFASLKNDPMVFSY